MAYGTKSTPEIEALIAAGQRRIDAMGDWPKNIDSVTPKQTYFGRTRRGARQ